VRADQTKDLQLVNDYLDRDIPVGGLEIDSLWSTGVNNFLWDTTKYPDAKGMINTLHQQGVRVILWVPCRCARLLCARLYWS
jgi:alpha-glucosidase (family GH31 glycosyl hydrolase)